MARKLVYTGTKPSILLHSKLCKLHPSFSRCICKTDQFSLYSLTVLMRKHRSFWPKNGLRSNLLISKILPKIPPSSCFLLMVTQPLQILRLSADHTKKALNSHYFQQTFTFYYLHPNWTHFRLLIKLVSVLLAQNLNLWSIDTIKTYLNNYSIKSCT